MFWKIVSKFCSLLIISQFVYQQGEAFLSLGGLGSSPRPGFLFNFFKLKLWHRESENFDQIWKIITILYIFLIISQFGYYEWAAFPAYLVRFRVSFQIFFIFLNECWFTGEATTMHGFKKIHYYIYFNYFWVRFSRMRRLSRLCGSVSSHSSELFCN